MNLSGIIKSNRSRSSSSTPFTPQHQQIPRDQFPLFHPDPLALIDIPWHASYTRSPAQHHPELDLFLRYALDQAYQWTTAHMPWSSASSTSHRVAGSAAAVQVCRHLSRFRPYKERREQRGPCAEHWFGRRSVHEDAARTGTASFAELRRVLKDRHAEMELRYHPDVVGATRVTTYEAASSRAAVGGGWTEATACVNTLTHKYPLCTARRYTVFEITASLPPGQPPDDPPGFIVLQLPLCPADFPSSGLADARDYVCANYVSIEMVRCLHADASAGPRLEWTMATSGQACGWIPESVQRSWSLGGVPKQIVKDVGFVLQYLAGERDKKNGDLVVPASG
ncbi:hypothetical protein LOZ61_003778 [Ophidiomyces ophidiicola]|nr:hypothetical protein LOZ61_003778 [Ophidiomyces ophidiicola]KAI1958265.1 hypothetical protein LOZ59_003579 [Ophidiomyces ophidiicola]KAI2124473.1 hypothetical protein LOZ31_004211 [Ophidiomyces ophidiicola]KAI2147464.1 hypothetical protein LOZ27_002622 [Ophidiomyces ophidiicola]KAI2157226.1 hypothetical protein LOZ25_003822 [Ophidiomyces ophidiicola]